MNASIVAVASQETGIVPAAHHWSAGNLLPQHTPDDATYHTYRSSICVHVHVQRAASQGRLLLLHACEVWKLHMTPADLQFWVDPREGNGDPTLS